MVIKNKTGHFRRDKSTKVPQPLQFKKNFSCHLTICTVPALRDGALGKFPSIYPSAAAPQIL